MTAREWLRLMLVGLGASVVPLDTAVNIAFPDITRSFGLPIAMIQWVVICYVLTYASLILAFGRVGDIFGHARVFRAGLLWSVAAFLACAAAPAYGWLLLCRFLQGVGAGLVISVAPALITGLFPEKRRGRAVAAFTMMFALGSAAGPLIGGTLVSLWGWPAVFWFRAPIALAALLSLRGLPAESRPETRERLDLPGAFLLALTIGSLLLLINALPHVGHRYGMVLGLVAVAITGLAAFLRRESRVAAPILDLRVFRSRGFAALNLASVLIYLASFSVLLFVPYYLVRYTALPLPLAGAVLAVSFAGTIAASPVAGRLIERIPANLVALFGAILGGAGLVAIGDWTPGGGHAVAILSALVAQGFGVGLFQVAYIDVVLGTIPGRHRGVAGSVAMLTRTLGIVGGATSLTVGFHTVAAAALARGQGANAAFLAAFHMTFMIAGTASAAIAIAALGLGRRR
ncbi:MAG TPA: MFS transporter [Stellaceae bacterium]|nr:MFS transporter [Stellaceae bacterium]